MTVIDDDLELIKEGIDPKRRKWLDDTLTIVKRICQRKLEFTSDDVWVIADYLEDTPEDRRLIGAVLTRASGPNFKYCAPTDKFVPSSRRACHGRRIMVWKSLLIEED